jgi:hypothetical protein
MGCWPENSNTTRTASRPRKGLIFVIATGADATPVKAALNRRTPYLPLDALSYRCAGPFVAELGLTLNSIWAWVSARLLSR